MALSQQFEGLMLVPWFNREEWDYVYKLLYEQNNLSGAYTMMKIWKQRTPKLPSAVECTLMILDAYILRDSSSDDSTRLLYSASIMRFLNLCCSQDDKQGTFTQKVKSHNIPEWLVNLRHDIAHSSSVPSLELLTCAVDFCFQWIHEIYWERQCPILENYSPSATISIESVRPALKSYCRIISLYYLKNCVKNAKEIDYYESKLKAVLTNYKHDDMDFISTVSNRLLQFIINETGEVRQRCHKELIVDTIISDGGLLLVYTKDNVYFDVRSALRLPKDFVNAWSNLIDFVFDMGCLQLLLERLLRIVNNEIVQPALRRTCGLWISYFLERLLLTKLIKESNVKGNIKKSAFRKFPNMRTLPPLVYHSEIESILSDIGELKIIAEDNPNIHTLLFVDILFELCGASGEETEIIRILANPKKEDEESIKDFDEIANICFDGDDNGVHIISNGVHLESMEHLANECRFAPVEDYSIFENCSLGVLRHQNTNTNPYLANGYSL
ncbi:hypothetical protein RI129_010601 [Pyrocoelia pectoralis]|uniref:Uncharacterized protein n=1 Tax=Pyrocoelia pectoralis TaxID=417401 RepID=A0AAN7UZ03_9COLE